MLGEVALDPPRVVVAVLPAALCGHPGGLDVSGGDRADPHVLPGGWDHQLGDALQDSGFTDGLPSGIDVPKGLSGLDPPDAGAGAGDAAEPDRAAAVRSRFGFEVHGGFFGRVTTEVGPDVAGGQLGMDVGASPLVGLDEPPDPLP